MGKFALEKRRRCRPSAVMATAETPPRAGQCIVDAVAASYNLANLSCESLFAVIASLHLPG